MGSSGYIYEYVCKYIHVYNVIIKEYEVIGFKKEWRGQGRSVRRRRRREIV